MYTTSLLRWWWCLLPFLFWQCGKDDALTPISDAFIFGYVTEFAPPQADVVRLYLLQDGQLFADDMVRPDDSLAFQPAAMSATDYQLALPAFETFPDTLWAKPNTVIGCPNCADQGTLVVMFRKKGQYYRWNLDPDEWALPAHLRPYAALLKEIVLALP